MTILLFHFTAADLGQGCVNWTRVARRQTHPPVWA